MSSPKREESENPGSSSGNLEEKPRLSEHEKKANHIASGTNPCPEIYVHLVDSSPSQSRNADRPSAKGSIG